MDYKIVSQICSYLKGNYNIHVDLVDFKVSPEIEIASWNKSVLVINPKRRGCIATAFLIAHVFGHIVQYQNDINYDHLLSVVNSKNYPLVLSNNFKTDYFEYEKEAFQIGKGLFEDVLEFNFDMDILYRSFMYADFDFFWKYITTGRKQEDNLFMTSWIKYISDYESIPHLSSIPPPRDLNFIIRKEIVVI